MRVDLEHPMRASATGNFLFYLVMHEGGIMMSFDALKKKFSP
jgi:hypothetical protein